MTPFYERDGIVIYRGDCREVLPSLELQADCAVADPPYSQTSLEWDRWPTDWPDAVVRSLAPSGSMWCFGSLRMFMERASQFSQWKMSQDVVWKKHNATGPDADRFRRVHELAAHFYRGSWESVFRNPQRIDSQVQERGKVKQGAKDVAHRGAYREGSWTDNGTRLMTTVIEVRSMHRRTPANETQKPLDIVLPLVEYACPPGGLILSPFGGSGTDAEAAWVTGRRAVLIDTRESQCEEAARRISQFLPRNKEST